MIAIKSVHIVHESKIPHVHNGSSQNDDTLTGAVFSASLPAPGSERLWRHEGGGGRATQHGGAAAVWGAEGEGAGAGGGARRPPPGRRGRRHRQRCRRRRPGQHGAAPPSCLAGTLRLRPPVPRGVPVDRVPPSTPVFVAGNRAKERQRLSRSACAAAAQATQFGIAGQVAPAWVAGLGAGGFAAFVFQGFRRVRSEPIHPPWQLSMPAIKLPLIALTSALGV